MGFKVNEKKQTKVPEQEKGRKNTVKNWETTEKTYQRKNQEIYEKLFQKVRN